MRADKRAARFGHRIGWRTNRAVLMPTPAQAANLRAIAADLHVDLWRLWLLLRQRPGFVWALPDEWPG